MQVGCTVPGEVALTMNSQLGAMHITVRRMPWYIKTYRELDCRRTCQKKIEKDR